MRILIQAIALAVTLNLAWTDAWRGLWGFTVVFGLESVYYTWTMMKRPIAVTDRLLAWLASLLIALFPLLIPYVIGPYRAVPWRVGLADILITAAVTLEILALLTLRTSFSQIPEARRVVRGGLYRLVRHPLYTAYFLAFAGEAVLVMEPVMWAAFALFVWLELVRARAEERLLADTFGDEYADYRQATGMFFPRVFRRKEGGAPPSRQAPPSAG